jgi:hypothetical protein
MIFYATDEEGIRYSLPQKKTHLQRLLHENKSFEGESSQTSRVF